MSLVTKTFASVDGNTTIFTSDFKIFSDDHIRVFVDGGIIAPTQYDIVNNSVIFNTAPAAGVTVSMQVGSTADDLLEEPTNVEVVASNVTDVNTLAANITDINTVSDISTKVSAVADNEANINTVAAIGSDGLTGIVNNLNNISTVANIYPSVQSVAANANAIASVSSDLVAINRVDTNETAIKSVANNMVDINQIVYQIIPKLNEILVADTNATIATTKAAEASASATIAADSASSAAASALLAASYVPDPMVITLTGTTSAIENSVVRITDTAFDPQGMYQATVNVGTVVDNQDGTYDITLPDYSSSTYCVLTVGGDRLGKQYNTATIGITITNTVLADPILVYPSEANEETTVNIVVSNYDNTATYITYYSEGTMINNGNGTFGIVLPTVASADTVYFSLQATRANDISSAVVSGSLNVIYVPIVADDAYVDLLTVDDSTYNDGFEVV